MLGNRMKINRLILAVVIYSLLYCPISITFAVNSSYVIASEQDKDSTELKRDSVINCLEGVVEMRNITREEIEKAYEEALKIPTPSYSECIKCVIERISPLIKRFKEKKNEEVRQLLKKAFNLVNYKKGIKYIDSAEILIIPLLSFDDIAYEECVLDENFDKNCNFLNLDTSKKNVEGFAFYNDNHGTMRKFDFFHRTNSTSTQDELLKKREIKDTTEGYFNIILDDIPVHSSYYYTIITPLAKENFSVPQFCIRHTRLGIGFALSGGFHGTHFIYDYEIYESTLITDFIEKNNGKNFEELFNQISEENKAKYIFRNRVFAPR